MEETKASREGFFLVPEQSMRKVGGKKNFLKDLKTNYEEDVDFYLTNHKELGRTTVSIHATAKCLQDFKVVVSDAEVSPNDLAETKIQRQVAAELDGVREVRCPAGIIDILSPKHRLLVEVKTFHKWMEGIGQLLSYGRYYPDYRKRLHLFRTPKRSGCSVEKILVVHETCLWANIELTFDASIEVEETCTTRTDKEEEKIGEGINTSPGSPK